MLFSPETLLNIRRSAMKVTKCISKFGSEISKMWKPFALFTSDRSRDRAHAQ